MLAPFAALATLLAMASPATAAPVAKCDVSHLPVPLPYGQTTLTVPKHQKVSLVTLGRGVQNYTCTDGLWVSKGAQANLYDLGCQATWVHSPQDLLGLSVPAIERIPFPQTTATPHIDLAHEFVLVGDKAFPAFFDADHPMDRVTGNLTAKIPAPLSPETNVPWLQLAAIPYNGALAKTVYRIGTQGGQPPKPTCAVEGRNLSVPYAAFYYFLN